jgi:uncharacterized LabA/DUF88 family protein
MAAKTSAPERLFGELMASNVAVLIDAGYLRACAVDLLSTNDLVFDPGEMRAYVQEFITEHFPTQRLLRIYWYDATRTGNPTPNQDAMARSDYFTCRLGILGRRVGGEPVQKEVDTLLTLDIVELARNRAVDDIVLITGDRDFRPAVMAAQVYGVRIHLIGVEPVEENQAKALAEACDTNRELDRAQLAKFCGFDLAALERARYTNLLPKISLAPALPNTTQTITGPQPEAPAEALSEADIQALLTHAAHEEFKKYINWKTDDEVVMHATQIIAQFRDEARFDNKLNSTLVKRVRKILATRGPTDGEIHQLQASFIDELTKHLEAAQLNGPDDSTDIINPAAAPSPKAANDAS